MELNQTCFCYFELLQHSNITSKKDGQVLSLFPGSPHCWKSSVFGCDRDGCDGWWRKSTLRNCLGELLAKKWYFVKMLLKNYRFWKIWHEESIARCAFPEILYVLPYLGQRANLIHTVHRDWNHNKHGESEKKWNAKKAVNACVKCKMPATTGGLKKIDIHTKEREQTEIDGLRLFSKNNSLHRLPFMTHLLWPNTKFFLCKRCWML